MNNNTARALLGLSEDDPTREEIEAAYELAIRLNNPGKHFNNERLRKHAEEQCRLINEAREVLLSYTQDEESHKEESPRYSHSEESTSQPFQQEGSDNNCNNCGYPLDDDVTICGKCGTRIDGQEEESIPVVKTWKTSIGFSILGLFVGIPLRVALSALVATLLVYLFLFLCGISLSVPAVGVKFLGIPLGFPSAIGELAATQLLTQTFLASMSLVYVTVIYPSYFTENPKLKSNRTISFANSMFGELLYGLLWNRNLTKKKIGISHKVLKIICILTLVWSVASLVFLVAHSVSEASSSSISSIDYESFSQSSKLDITPLERGTGGTSTYVDAETGASFVMPVAWSQQSLDFQENQLSGTEFRVTDSTYAGYAYIKTDPKDAMHNYSAKGWYDALLGYKEGYAISDAREQRIIINGIEFFLVGGTYTASTAEKQDFSIAWFVRVERGYVHLFQYTTTAEFDFLEGEGWGILHQMIASLGYQ